MKTYLAVDLGAESGRIIIGSIVKEKLTLKEIHRFPNGMLNINGSFFWNIGQLYSEIVKGIELCVNTHKIIPASIGIDTWGVDYGLLAEDNTLLGLPYAYRDPRTENAIEELSVLLSKECLYHKTGNLFASYNTIFQLFAAKKRHPKLVDAASNLLFIPDLLAFFLTGEKVTEFSFATTSQLFNRSTNSWDLEIFEVLDISPAIMQRVVYSGETIGLLTKATMARIKCDPIPVVAVATHDTASALAAIPIIEKNSAILSSGTWSILGIRTSKAVITPYTLEKNFTNEGGIGGCNYLLKNLMGLWILQQLKASLLKGGVDYSYSELVAVAGEAKPFLSFIDIDDPCFLNPTDMCEAISIFCAQTGQRIPVTPGEHARIAIESLAMKYREAIDDLRVIVPVEALAITGGGINNELLCQYTANVCNMKVVATLAEGTAAGNIMAQALASGEIRSYDNMLDVAQKSCNPREYLPSDTLVWGAAYERYKMLTVARREAL